jgi:hypothetical protein
LAGHLFDFAVPGKPRAQIVIGWGAESVGVENTPPGPDNPSPRLRSTPSNRLNRRLPLRTHY